MNRKSELKQQRKERIRQVMAQQQSAAPLAEWFKASLTRRTFGKGLAWSAVLGAAGLTVYQLASGGDNEVSMDSLDAQRKSGWNVGSTNRALTFDGSAAKDSRDAAWPKVTDGNLLPVYQPRTADWQPFFVPTLIQSLQQESLQTQMRPIVTPQMRETYARGEGLRELLSQAQNKKDTLIIADLPGPESVALGAALAGTADLVPVFDNWPHPLGVVKAHETLGAMTYYANEVQEKKATLKDDAPALLLLDNRRLTPYQDEETQFDNRYLAKVPPADQLKQRGITSVMYVVRDANQPNELDDLNEDFVNWQQQGINVKLLRMSDFQPYDEEVVKQNADGTTTRATERHHYYYGHPHSHWWFYPHYFYSPYPTASYYSGGGYRPMPRTSQPVANPVSYRPVTRPTMFSGTRVGGTSPGVGRVKPTGFGRTSVRVSSSGQVTGTRSGRSGSYGRGFGGWFGG
jgi:hypothetical protein